MLLAEYTKCHSPTDSSPEPKVYNSQPQTQYARTVFKRLTVRSQKSLCYSNNSLQDRSRTFEPDWTPRAGPPQFLAIAPPTNDLPVTIFGRPCCTIRLTGLTRSSLPTHCLTLLCDCCAAKNLLSRHVVPGCRVGFFFARSP